MKSLYKTPEHKQEILAIYQEKLDELKIEYEYQKVETAFGETNIIVTGNPENPPLVLVHGSNGCAPIALEIFPNLSKKYCVYAVDVIAQPNRSSEHRPSMKDLSYGKWMNEVLAKLNLSDVVMAGFSLGGLVILKTLLYDESRIKKAFLVAPAFIVNGNPLKAIFKVFIPMKRYMRTQNQKYLEKFLHALFSERDEFAIKCLSKVFLYFDMDFSPVPVIKARDAQSIKTPIVISCAEKDLLFPGRKMLRRAINIFPSFEEGPFFEGSKHVQNKEDFTVVENRILDG